MRKVPELRFDGFDEDWKDSKIQNIINVTSVKRVHKSDWATSGIPFLRARDLVSIINKTEVDEKLFISEELYNKYSKISGKVKQNDVLITGVGSIGVPYLVKNNKPLYFKDGNIIWFVNDNKLDGWFFYSQLLTSRIQDYIRASSGKGTVDTLTITTAKDINVIFPNNDEQEKIGLLFKKIDGLIEIQEGKVSKMEDFKKSMLQKMFPKKGELVPEFRFDGFDGEWEKKKISDIGKISAGGDVDKKKISNKGRYPVIANGDSNNGIIGYYEDHYKISEPAVTISARGNIGTAVARNYPFTPVIRVLTLTSDNNIYFMSEAINRLRIFNESSGVPQLTSPQFGGYNIFMTKLSEQDKIGQFFKNLDTQIENEEKLLESYKMMKKSLLQKMFV